MTHTVAQVVYLLGAAGVAVCLDATIIRFLAGKRWPAAFGIALTGLTPFLAAVGGFFLLLATPFYRAQEAWTMTLGFPLMVLVGLLLAAWIARALVLWRLAGRLTGCVVGLIVFACFWAGALAGKRVVWSALDGWGDRAAEIGR